MCSLKVKQHYFTTLSRQEIYNSGLSTQQYPLISTIILTRLQKNIRQHIERITKPEAVKYFS